MDRLSKGLYVTYLREFKSTLYFLGIVFWNVVANSGNWKGSGKDRGPIQDKRKGKERFPFFARRIGKDRSPEKMDRLTCM